jgi:2-phospho-L-lactate guanylyltransferase
MLADVLGAVCRAPSITGSAVVSPDERVLDFARLHGAKGLIESALGLNEAIKLAITRVMSLGATSVLIVPGDLPFMRPADIENMISMVNAERDVVIAPSKTKGTNALLIRPPDLLELRFGGESFPSHVKEALRVGIRPRIYRSETVAFDIDEPADLLKIETLGLGTRSHGFLSGL